MAVDRRHRCFLAGAGTTVEAAAGCCCKADAAVAAADSSAGRHMAAAARAAAVAGTAAVADIAAAADCRNSAGPVVPARPGSAERLHHRLPLRSCRPWWFLARAVLDSTG